MNNLIRCVHCGKNFEVSEALSHEIAEEAEKIKQLAEKQAREEVRKEAEETERERNKILLEQKKKNEQLAQTLAEFEKNKKEEEEKIKEETEKQTQEKFKLEKLELEKKIGDMQKALEEAQRKGKQGSQQLQGEVLELELEEQLKQHFPLDEFLPVPKGVEGADIWQKVRDEQGREVGAILWETKRTKTFDKKWLAKLREDTRRVNASECILVTQVLPTDVRSFHRIDRVWITNYEFALHLARTVRYLLLRVASIKNSLNHGDAELENLRRYITSDAFIHKIEAHEEAVKALREDLFSEIRLTQVRWKKRETQINRLDASVSQLYGELQGRVPTLPDLKTESLPAQIDEE